MYLPVYITGVIASGFCLYATLRFLKSVVTDEDPEDLEDTSEIVDGALILVCFIGAAALPLSLLMPLFNLFME